LCPYLAEAPQGLLHFDPLMRQQLVQLRRCLSLLKLMQLLALGWALQ